MIFIRSCSQSAAMSVVARDASKCFCLVPSGASCGFSRSPQPARTSGRNEQRPCGAGRDPRPLSHVGAVESSLAAPSPHCTPLVLTEGPRRGALGREAFLGNLAEQASEGALHSHRAWSRWEGAGVGPGVEPLPQHVPSARAVASPRWLVSLSWLYLLQQRVSRDRPKNESCVTGFC